MSHKISLNNTVFTIMDRGEVKDKRTPDRVMYFNSLSPSVPIYASPCMICADPFAVIVQPGHTLMFAHPAAVGWFISRQQQCFDGGFHFRADESAIVMWWNECFVHQLPPSTQIDGACNWWPLCVIAKINRHCCGHGRSMSRTKQARGGIYGPSYSTITNSNYAYWQGLSWPHTIVAAVCSDLIFCPA